MVPLSTLQQPAQADDGARMAMTSHMGREARSVPGILDHDCITPAQLSEGKRFAGKLTLVFLSTRSLPRRAHLSVAIKTHKTTRSETRHYLNLIVSDVYGAKRLTYYEEIYGIKCYVHNEIEIFAFCKKIRKRNEIS